MIRRAEEKDIARIGELLLQVCNVHHEGRKDLFRRDGRKYNDEELREILLDEETPIFVSVDENDYVLGYCFCILQRHIGLGALTDHTTLYIDDLCIDQTIRGKGIGKSLYEYAKAFAKDSGCYNVTLNVWGKNDGARAFYEKLGMQVQKIGMEEIL